MFFMSTWWMDFKNIKKKFFSRWLIEIIHIIRFEIWDLRSRDPKIFLWYDINYLSIWPFMRHPWISTRKASKLTFVCFQLATLWNCIGKKATERNRYIWTEKPRLSVELLHGQFNFPIQNYGQEFLKSLDLNLYRTFLRKADGLNWRIKNGWYGDCWDWV